MSLKILKENIMKKKINWISIGLYSLVWGIILFLIWVAYSMFS